LIKKKIIIMSMILFVTIILICSTLYLVFGLVGSTAEESTWGVFMTDYGIQVSGTVVGSGEAFSGYTYKIKESIYPK